MAIIPTHDNSDKHTDKPSGPRKRIDPELLRKMGFPEGLIKEAVAREKSGVLDHPPPADLLERTIEACKKAINGVSPEAIKKARDKSPKESER